MVTGPKTAEPVGDPQHYHLNRAATRCQDTDTSRLQDSSRQQETSNKCEIIDAISQVHSPDDLYEFESQKQCTPQVKGNLRKNVEFWRDIGTCQFILDVITHGYKLPLTEQPERAWLKNNKSALSYQEFVDVAINELVQSNRVIETQEPPFVINPLSVSVQSNGKKKLILDLRHVNKCLRKDRVKYEDWKVALNYFTVGGYMFSFDLKSGYHHIEIAKTVSDLFRLFLEIRARFTDEILHVYCVTFWIKYSASHIY